MAKKVKATHDGKLSIGDFVINCSVLEGERRVVSEGSLSKAFGIKGGGAHWRRKKLAGDTSAVLPGYLSAGYLKPFITKELQNKLSSAVDYETSKGAKATGVDATVLPEICDVYIKAKESGILNASQMAVAEKAYILLKGFATIGIIALVDEATGYQEVRDKNELQKILKAYISEELLPWTKRFPDEFYKEMFRLNKWDFNPVSVKRPSVIGTWTNKLIYKQLPKGVLKELKTNTPRDSKGRTKHRFHQLLTDEIGNPHLEKQLVSVITLMNVSSDWDDFQRLFAKKYGQQVLDI